MKEATGEVSMTVVTLIAVGVIGAIVALFWPRITKTIDKMWGEVDVCIDPQTGQEITCPQENN